LLGRVDLLDIVRNRGIGYFQQYYGDVDDIQGVFRRLQW